MKPPTKPGFYRCRIPQKWQTREIVLGNSGELRIVTKEGSEKLYDGHTGSMSGFEWLVSSHEDAQLEIPSTAKMGTLK